MLCKWQPELVGVKCETPVIIRIHGRNITGSNRNQISGNFERIPQKVVTMKIETVPGNF